MESYDFFAKIDTGPLFIITEPSETASEYDLIPSIWQELPVELINFVLTKLPGSVQKKFRRVSKSWNALINSCKFAHQCSSLQSAICYFAGGYNAVPYIAIPNLRTGSWVKQFQFFALDEDEDNISEEDDYDLIAADHGLFCYRICYSSDSYHDDIALVIHNPFTGHWTTLIVPYAYEGGMASRISNSILGGLVMDQDTGTYKVIVAFVDADLPRKTFIYDSSSDSWTTSAAISPVLGRDVDEELVEGEFSGREIGRSIACGRDLFWIVGMSTGDGYLRTLIKYSFELDNWSTFSKLWPDDVNWRPVYLACFENWPYVVNFDSSSDGTRLLTEFLNLVPGLGKFDGDDFERLVNQSETACFPDGLKPYRAIAEGGTWFVECERLEKPWPRNCELTIFAFSKDGSVTRLPELHVEFPLSPCSFAVTFKAFV